MGLKDDIGSIKTVSDGLTQNKVSQFAYDSTAYDNNLVEGEDTYNVNDHNCIPKSTLSILKINATVRDKGYRARASSLTRMLLNHLFGRTSYNLNKVNDLFNSLLFKLYSYIGTADGLATLDANGRIPYSQLPESAVELKGYWNADTNTPALVDGTGDTGDEYYVSVAGTQNLGSGSQYFNVGDRVLYLDGVWRNINATAVKKVNNIAPNAEGNVPVNGAISGLFSDNLTVSRALASDANGKIVASGVTATELGYLSGATSNIQEQLNSKSTVSYSRSFVSHEAIQHLDTATTYYESRNGILDIYDLIWGDSIGAQPSTLTLTLEFTSSSGWISEWHRLAGYKYRVSYNGVAWTDWKKVGIVVEMYTRDSSSSVSIDLTSEQALGVVRFVEVIINVENLPDYVAHS